MTHKSRRIDFYKLEFNKFHSKYQSYFAVVYSVFAVLISIMTFVSTNFVHRADVSVVVNADAIYAKAKIDTTTGHEIEAHTSGSQNIIITFINSVTTDVAVINVEDHIGYVNKDDVAAKCSIRYSKNPRYLVLSPDDKSFSPFVVKKGEIEVKSFALKLEYDTEDASDTQDAIAINRAIQLCANVHIDMAVSQIGIVSGEAEISPYQRPTPYNLDTGFFFRNKRLNSPD